MWRHIRLGGRSSGDAPTNLDAKLEVWDNPNSASVAVYAARCAKLALDRRISGASAYFMNFPPQQYTGDVARDMTESFISGSE